MSEEIDHERRRFIGTVATAMAAAQFGMFDSAAAAQSSNANPATLPQEAPQAFAKAVVEADGY